MPPRTLRGAPDYCWGENIDPAWWQGCPLQSAPVRCGRPQPCVGARGKTLGSPVRARTPAESRARVVAPPAAQLPSRWRSSWCLWWWATAAAQATCSNC
eukprot:353707-Chlamydomonas_euryale.AAC.7